MKKRLALILSVICVLGSVMGCSTKTTTSSEPGETKSTSRQNEKKELTVYTALENEQIDKYIQSFKDQYPDITVNFVRDSTGIITAKLVAEGTNTPADLVWGTAVSSLLVLDQNGISCSPCKA